MASIKKNYDISSNWTGSAYFYLQLDWGYINGTVDVSMPRYIKEALHKYQHPAPTYPEHALHQWNPPVYGTKTQYVEDTKDSPALSPKDVTRLQQLGGTLLYYARTVDSMLIMPVNVLASEQTRVTAATADKIIKLLNYCNTHPEATLRYHASDMILNIHSDASYLSEREAKNRSGGFLYMGSNTYKAKKLTNGSILIISTVLKYVMSSAAEAKSGAVFLNAKEGTVFCTKLEEVGHPQPPTPLQNDNTTSTGYSNGTIKQKRTRVMDMDMRFYWVKDRVQQGQFHVYWGQDTNFWGITLRNTIRQRII
jgi:hypothetical protein